MSKANPSIGTCPCPVSGCKEQAAVRKFAQRATTEQGKRMAGKLYLDCPVHGRWGSDGKPAITEHILENITWPSDAARREFAAERGPKSAEPSMETPQATPSLPASSHAAKPSPAAPSKQAEKPAAATAPASVRAPPQATAQQAKKPGFWEW